MHSKVSKIPTVGVLWHAANAEEEGPYFRALLEGFRELGYVDGLNIKFEALMLCADQVPILRTHSNEMR